MDARSRFIGRVEKVHAVLAVVSIAVAAARWGQPVWSGVMLGALLGGLNFRALSVLAARFTRTGDATARSGAMGLIILKMGAMMAAVAVVMIVAKPSGAAFVVGISAAPVALLLVSGFARPTFDDDPSDALATAQQSPRGVEAR